MNTKSTLSQIDAIYRAYDRAFAKACKAPTAAEQSRLARLADERRVEALADLRKYGEV